MIIACYLIVTLMFDMLLLLMVIVVGIFMIVVCAPTTSAVRLRKNPLAIVISTMFVIMDMYILSISHDVLSF